MYIYLYMHIYIYTNIYIYIYTSYHQLAAAKVNTPCVDLSHGWHQRSGFPKPDLLEKLQTDLNLCKNDIN